MPKRGLQYPVTRAWREAVLLALRERGWAQRDLARTIGCSEAMVSLMLSGRGTQSALVPRVNHALGWAMPLTEAPHGDLGELLAIWDHLDEINRARVLERARALRDLQDA